MKTFNTRTIETITPVAHSHQESILDNKSFNCAVILNGQYTRVFGYNTENPIVKMNVGDFYQQHKTKRLGKKISAEVVEIVKKIISQTK